MLKTPWNPSKRATARVKNPLPTPALCPCCEGRDIVIKGHEALYGRNYSDWPWVYFCQGCDAYVGLHPFTSIPLGTLADQDTRRARSHCKVPFEALYKTGKLSRDQAYEQLAQQLGIDKAACHFGWFNSEMCYKAAEAARVIFLTSPNTQQ